MKHISSLISVLLLVGCYSSLFGQVYSNPIASTGNTFSGTIVCEKPTRYYSEITQDSVVEFTADNVNSEYGGEAVVRIAGNAIDSVKFTGFDYVYGFSPNMALDSGTYEIYFRSAPEGMTAEFPSASIIALSVGETDPTNVVCDTCLLYDPFLAIDAMDDSTRTEIGGGVQRIDSRAPGTVSLIQNTSSARPENVNDTLVFVKSSEEFMSANSVAGTIDGNDTPYSYAAVFKFTSLPATDFNYLWGAGSSTDADPVSAYSAKSGSNGGQWQLARRDDTGTQGKVDYGARDTSWHVLAVSFSGTAITVYLDGTKVVNGSASNVGVQTMDIFTVGAINAAAVASFSDLKLLDLYMYDSALSDAQLESISNDLNLEHSIY